MDLISLRHVDRPPTPTEGMEVVAKRDLMSITFSRICPYL